jgi:methylthioribose-1-phosphate isomerase
MQEQKTNLVKIINSSIDEIKQKMFTICENGYITEMDYNSAIGFIRQIKEVKSIDISGKFGIIPRVN